MNTSNIPVTHEELMNVRQRLNIEDPYPGRKDVQLYPGNPDLLFVANILQNFKSWKEDIDKATKNELQIFEGKYPQYIVNLRKVLGKERDTELTLGNAFQYLDVYFQGLANGLTPRNDVLDKDMVKATEQYFKHFFKGLFSNPAMVRVLSNGYIHHICALMSLKKQDHQNQDLQDTRIHQIKASFDFGNKLTILSFFKSIRVIIRSKPFIMTSLLN